MLAPAGSKDKVIRKFEFVAKTQFFGVRNLPKKILQFMYR